MKGPDDWRLVDCKEHILIANRIDSRDEEQHKFPYISKRELSCVLVARSEQVSPLLNYTISRRLLM